jgi:hypothetical protein
MTTPGVEVVTSSLIKAAAIWDRQGTAITGIAPKAEGMRLDRWDAGVFQLIVDPYEQVVDQVSARCTEGGKRMHDIGDTLVHCAQTYRDAEHTNTSAIGNIH